MENCGKMNVISQGHVAPTRRSYDRGLSTENFQCHFMKRIRFEGRKGSLIDQQWLTHVDTGRLMPLISISKHKNIFFCLSRHSRPRDLRQKCLQFYVDWPKRDFSKFTDKRFWYFETSHEIPFKPTRGKFFRRKFSQNTSGSLSN